MSQSLEELRERYALEVSSPGLDRRLRKPAHFAAALGSEVAVTHGAAASRAAATSAARLAAADDQSITLTLEGGSSATLPLDVPRQGARGLQP